MISIFLLVEYKSKIETFLQGKLGTNAPSFDKKKIVALKRYVPNLMIWNNLWNNF